MKFCLPTPDSGQAVAFLYNVVSSSIRNAARFSRTVTCAGYKAGYSLGSAVLAGTDRLCSVFCVTHPEKTKLSSRSVEALSPVRFAEIAESIAYVPAIPVAFIGGLYGLAEGVIETLDDDTWCITLND